MFNFKSKRKSIDQQIHDSVYSAQELLLQEAQNILDKAEKDTETVQRVDQLIKLGFTSFDQAEARQEALIHENLKATIEYYNTNYPLYKFITEDAVKRICKQYNLILAPASRYISNIPEKNQEEIINFRVKAGDLRMDYGLTSIGCDWEETGSKNFITGEDMLIVAPEDKLNIKNATIEGHMLKINDPIVLQPVRSIKEGFEFKNYHPNNGYLIVTAWGFEAGDPEVANPKMN